MRGGDSPGSLALRRSRRRWAASPVPGVFADVFDAACDAIVLIDPHAELIVRANRAVERDLGYDPANLVGAPASVVLPGDVLGQGSGLAATVRQRGPQLGEHGLRRADGSTVRMDVNACIIQRGGGEVIVATLRDVSERAHAAEALRQSEERLDLVLQGADIGLWDWNL